MEARKFIIYDDQIRMGLVERHAQLLPKEYEHSLIKGGGRWEYKPNEFSERLYIWGRSIDFGWFRKEDFLKAWENSYKNSKLEAAELIVVEGVEYFSQVLEQHNPFNNEQT